MRRASPATTKTSPIANNTSAITPTTATIDPHMVIPSKRVAPMLVHVR